MLWTLAYTPGTPLLPQPTPQVTSPTTYHRPVLAWQTSGAPPSPSQASFSAWPPAQTSDRLNRKFRAFWPAFCKALLMALSQVLKSSRIDVAVVTSGEGDSLLKEEDGHVMVEPLGVIVGVDTVNSRCCSESTPCWNPLASYSIILTFSRSGPWTFLSLWAAVMTRSVPEAMLFSLLSGTMAQLPTKSLLALRTRQVHGIS